jgi:hypothetical protein
MRSIASYGTGFFVERAISYPGNVHLSLSGGRSSGAMLRLLLDINGGALPPTYKVIFTNTGKEHPKTLEFVQRMSDEWKVDIIWLELESILPSDRAVTFKQVTFDTAARNGEPFYVIREKKPKFPPRRANRLCTLYTKVLPARAYIEQELGWEAWSHLLGYRADEGGRLNKAPLRCGKDTPFVIPDAPLLRAGIDKPSVLAFWEQYSFDLGIPHILGNCVFCFLKDELKLRRITQMMPGGIDWYIDLEQGWGADIPMLNGKGFFILPNGGYAGVKARALAELAPPEEDSDGEDLECNCTD